MSRFVAAPIGRCGDLHTGAGRLLPSMICPLDLGAMLGKRAQKSIWYGYSTTATEPPTRITKVDRNQCARPGANATSLRCRRAASRTSGSPLLRQRCYLGYGVATTCVAQRAHALQTDRRP